MHLLVTIGVLAKHDFPDSKFHVAHMGPTWVLSSPVGLMLAPWPLLSGLTSGSAIAG